MKVIIKILLFLIAFLFVSFVFVIFLNKTINQNPEREYVDIRIAGLDSRLEGKRFLHISDLNSESFGENQEKLEKLLKSDRISAVFFTGDILGKRNDFSAISNLVRFLPNDLPMYIIAGDDDPPIYENGDYAFWIKKLAELNVKYLDAPEKLVINGVNVWICPFESLVLDVEQSRASYLKTIEEAKDKPELEDSASIAKIRLDVLEKTEKAMFEMLATDSYIALSHVPLTENDISMLYESKNKKNKFPGQLSLVLSGHFINGQARLPFLGSLYYPPQYEQIVDDDDIENGKRLSGLFYMSGVAQHISPGLSYTSVYNSRLNCRFLNKPKLSYLTISAGYKYKK